MTTIRANNTQDLETPCSREVTRAFKLGEAGISGASAGALVGSAIGGLPGGVVGAVIIGGANMLLNFHNERHPSV